MVQMLVLIVKNRDLIDWSRVGRKSSWEELISIFRLSRFLGSIWFLDGLDVSSYCKGQLGLALVSKFAFFIIQASFGPQSAISSSLIIRAEWSPVNDICFFTVEIDCKCSIYCSNRPHSRCSSLTLGSSGWWCKIMIYLFFCIPATT